jgi:hypothetical protein
VSDGAEAATGPEPTGRDAGSGGSVAVRDEPEREPVAVSPSVYRRLMSGVPGFAAAMLVCLAIIGVVILLTPRRNPGAVPRVDYRPDLTALRATAPYTVWAPQGLPSAWYPTSSRLTGTKSGPVAWHLGFYTPSREYAALEESDERPDGPAGFVSRMTSQGRPDGALAVGGVTWEKTFRPDKRQRSLVRRAPGLTLVVTGTASYEELAVLAGSLRPQP